jgi:hypothetical protein
LEKRINQEIRKDYKMIITITVKDETILKAVNLGMVRGGYPADDVLDDADLIDSGDILRWIMPILEIDEKDVDIDRS